MALLILGLIIFLGIHSINLVFPALREKAISKFGLFPWKGLYALIAILGFILIVNGYSRALDNPIWLWQSPLWLNHLTALFMIPAFILLVAAYLPANVFKARMGHPMLIATKIWSILHLAISGTLAGLFLFGGFLVWSVVSFAVLRRRDRASNKRPVEVVRAYTITTIIAGVVLWAIFAFWAHYALMGIAPFGR